MTYEEKIEKLREIIAGSNNIVFFGGAGVSTESGVPDFRSEDGLYRQKYKFPPEFMLSHTCYERLPEEFFKYYRDKLLVPGIQPNKAHKKLAQWEKEGKLKAVITQNIDGLHQAAGTRNVLELHGSTLRNYCERCGKFYDAEYIMHSEGVPTCSCGGRIKPDVV
ncbi:MAG: NAD-dependent protein deacylase, partial [Lachnospiraceae bacterium]|nr:NAD-dependent protein deacylase [Lachnospiraceae bacterium]